ncbi:AraC family transcriptional regulator [Xenorhabdus cabanillasii JM26]|nr:AraC family transcriptional regulator [Xenorhabdus cabanillasii JM26]
MSIRKCSNQIMFQPLELGTPDSLIFRDETLNADTECMLHSHPFGQLIYVVCGVIEMTVEGASSPTPSYPQGDASPHRTRLSG